MKRFNSVKEMMNDMKKNYNWWDKFILNPKMNWLRWLIYNLPEVPMDIYKNIKWFIQRGKRGYSDRDIWSVDYYLAEIIPKMLKQLKEIQKIEKEEIPQKRWNSYLDKIIKTFETAYKIANNHYIYCESFEYDTEPNKKHREGIKNVNFLTIMTKNECKEYEEGWRLFRKYFFKLWD